MNIQDKRLELEGILVEINLEKLGKKDIYICEIFSSDSAIYYALIPYSHLEYYLNNLDYYKNRICKFIIKGITINNITRYKLEQLL